ncbi:MAG: RT0821/Lpp0805 family surface protein [Pseudomonadota bacterium]|nr:RT0821/Lpp0805 family surface protein [Pseudomonadota bacterium]
MRHSPPPYPWASGPSRARIRHGTRIAGTSTDRAPGSARRLVVLAAIAAAGLSLGGCSLNSSVASLESEPAFITSSITKPVKAEGIDSTDAELIKNVVAEAEDSNALAWSNPDTGSRGTIMAIDKFTGGHGQKCKKFQTTVDTFMGVSLYNGETCELRKGFWVLSWFLRDKQ